MKVNYSNILIRATNWIGDAVMCLPALRAIRDRFPEAHITILAKSWVADLYAQESFTNQMLMCDAKPWWSVAQELRRHRFDCAILLQNAFGAAWVACVAGIPARIGYNRDGRGLLLTRAVKVPKRGEIPVHQRFYYLELLRRAGLIEKLPAGDIAITPQTSIRDRKRIIGISPGAAYGTAKRWLPARFAEAAAELASARGASVALFGSRAEHDLCEQIAQRLNGHNVTNYAGRTTLEQFIELAARCELFLTNDSGAMHIASALGVPTVAIFGATDDAATGPIGPKARAVREKVECSPCLLRECPIDHRCMTRVSASRVVREALDLLATKSPTDEPRRAPAPR
jgi:heptosyltransferase-2